MVMVLLPVAVAISRRDMPLFHITTNLSDPEPLLDGLAPFPPLWPVPVHFEPAGHAVSFKLGDRGENPHDGIAERTERVKVRSSPGHGSLAPMCLTCRLPFRHPA